MLYCLSQNSKYFLRYGRMTIAVWELSFGLWRIRFPPVLGQTEAGNRSHTAIVILPYLREYLEF